MDSELPKDEFPPIFFWETNPRSKVRYSQAMSKIQFRLCKCWYLYFVVKTFVEDCTDCQNKINTQTVLLSGMINVGLLWAYKNWRNRTVWIWFQQNTSYKSVQVAFNAVLQHDCRGLSPTFCTTRRWIYSCSCSAKTTKPHYSSLSILVVVLVHFIVRSEIALVA
jgi:hypothetical protein